MVRLLNLVCGKLTFATDLNQGYINLTKKRIEEADILITTKGRTLTKKNQAEEDIYNHLYDVQWDRLSLMKHIIFVTLVLSIYRC